MKKMLKTLATGFMLGVATVLLWGTIVAALKIAWDVTFGTLLEMMQG